MTEQEKNKLIKEICAKLPFGNLKVTLDGLDDKIYNLVGINLDNQTIACVSDSGIRSTYFIDQIDTLPNLRRLRDITTEEERELDKKFLCSLYSDDINIRYHRQGYWDDDTEVSLSGWSWLIDWLNEHKFTFCNQ